MRKYSGEKIPVLLEIQIDWNGTERGAYLTVEGYDRQYIWDHQLADVKKDYSKPPYTLVIKHVKASRNPTPERSPRFTSIKRVPTGKTRTYQVTEYPRMDVTDTHYTVYHGLTKEEVTEQFNIPDEEFDECIDSGYIGKDSENEWEIEEE